jgi:hypothetical protein
MAEEEATWTRAPWQVLVLDPSGDDPKWLILTVNEGSDVRAAVMDAGRRRYTDWPAVAEWVRDRVGQRVRLVPVAATGWRIDFEGSAG